MIGLDTNILIRYLTEDDDDQFRAVLVLLSRPKVEFFVSDIVLMELEWVLRTRYLWESSTIASEFERLLQVSNLFFEDTPRLRKALKGLRTGADLTDELIAAGAQQQRCTRLASFDKNFAKRHPKFVFHPKG